MCKIMIAAGIPSNKRHLMAKFVRKSVKHMSEHDKDGLGYVALGKDGVFGERWLKNENAFKSRKVMTPEQKCITDFFGENVLNNFVDYTNFGTGNIRNASSILLHTRMATCDVNMTNTHPFVIEDTALIHNGVIDNSDEIMKKYEEDRISTCDSEAIIHEYLFSNVNQKPKNIEDLAFELEGWYAAGILSKNKNGYFVDIFKCNGSSLFVGLIKELDSFVFCTEVDILANTAKDAGMTLTAYDEIVGGSFIRLDAVTGDKLESIMFKPNDPTFAKKTFYEPDAFKQAAGADWVDF